MSDYLFDLFISYKAHPEWNHWTRHHVYKNLKSYMSDELPRPPRIYLDDHTQKGADWVNRIGSALGRSKALVAVLSVPYFSSDWCLHELDLMYSRLSGNRNTAIIFPIVVSTRAADFVPPEIKRLQICNLKDYRNSALTEGTSHYQGFSECLKDLSLSIVEAIQDPPPCEAMWESQCRQRFNEVFHARSNGCSVSVTSLTLSTPPRQTSVPRPVL
jgi:hypothetical protein